MSRALGKKIRFKPVGQAFWVFRRETYPCPCCLGNFEFRGGSQQCWVHVYNPSYVEETEKPCPVADQSFGYRDVEDAIVELDKAARESDPSRYFSTGKLDPD